MPQQESARVREFSARCDRIRKQMQTCDLDCLFLMQPMNVWYVSGFWEYVPIRIEAVIIPRQGDCVFIVSKNEYEYAVKTSWISDIRYYTEFPEKGRHQNPYDLIVDAIRDRGLERAVMGVEEDFMPISDYSRLKGLLPKVTFKDGSPVLKRCRMIKSPYEVDLLKKAGAVACAGWHASLEVAGMHEYEIGEAARKAATRTAASFMSEVEDKHHSPLTDGVQLVQAGERSSISHGRTREMRDVYRLLYDAQMAAFDELKPGVKGSHLDRLVRERIDAAGYGQYIEHRLGRGVGVLYAEAPDLKEGDDTIIEADFCLSIEPAVYISGKWGIEIEDSVHVTANGWEYLTEPAPPELPIV